MTGIGFWVVMSIIWFVVVALVIAARPLANRYYIRKNRRIDARKAHE